MNFIMKFLEKRFFTHEHAEKSFDRVSKDIKTVFERVNMNESIIWTLGDRVADLEKKFESYESMPSDKKMVNAAAKYAEASKKGKIKDKEILGKRIENIANELEKIKTEKNPFRYSNKDAIIDILNKHRGEKLVCEAVYAKLKTYNTKKPHVPLTSVRATLYWMARENISGIKLCDETETARFFIEKE